MSKQIAQPVGTLSLCCTPPQWRPTFIFPSVLHPWTSRIGSYYLLLTLASNIFTLVWSNFCLYFAKWASTWVQWRPSCKSSEYVNVLPVGKYLHFDIIPPLTLKQPCSLNLLTLLSPHLIQFSSFSCRYSPVVSGFLVSFLSCLHMQFQVLSAGTWTQILNCLVDFSCRHSRWKFNPSLSSTISPLSCTLDMLSTLYNDLNMKCHHGSCVEGLPPRWWYCPEVCSSNAPMSSLWGVGAGYRM